MDHQRVSVEAQVVAIKKSSWLEVLERERKDKAEREDAERKARAQRLAILFEEEDEDNNHDNEDILDPKAANYNVDHYINRIETHL